MHYMVLYRGPLSSCNYGCVYCPFAKKNEAYAELAGDRAALEGRCAERPVLRPARVVTRESRDPHDGPAEVVKCDGPRLAVLMMKWCQEKRIPLPRNARKFLRVTKDSVVLRLEN